MNREKSILVLSLILAVLIAFVNSSGLLYAERLYARETSSWYAQSIGQDFADLLFGLPVLLISSFYAFHGNRLAAKVRGGVLAYFAYTFTIYCFAIHFNFLFIPYCAVLGLSIFLLLKFLLQLKEETVEAHPASFFVTASGWYMIVVGGAFFMLWIRQIVSAMATGNLPDEILQTGLFTNPVHVLDLSVCLPAITGTGILLLRGKEWGYRLAPVILTFFIIMDLSLFVLMIILQVSDGKDNTVIAASMFFMAGLSFFLLRGLNRSSRLVRFQ